MSYFVVCSFDLRDADDDDYQTAYHDLAALGLQRQLTSSRGTVVTLPTTTTAGEFSGTSAAQVRDDMSERVRRAFEKRGLTSEIFVSAAGSWAWGHRTT